MTENIGIGQRLFTPEEVLKRAEGQRQLSPEEVKFQVLKSLERLQEFLESEDP